jgi:hypothetical protein
MTDFAAILGEHKRLAYWRWTARKPRPRRRPIGCHMAACT